MKLLLASESSQYVLNSAARLQYAPKIIHRELRGDFYEREGSVRESNEQGSIRSGKGQPSVADPLAVLFTKSTEGFEDDLTFSNGRLISVASTLSGISPQDADAFDSRTVNQLGRPDVNVTTVQTVEGWVWIDGDVQSHVRTPLPRPDSSGVNFERSGPIAGIDRFGGAKARFSS